MKTISYNQGQSLLGIVICFIIAGLIAGGLYFYLQKQIPEILEITEKSTKEESTSKEEIVKPEEDTFLPEEPEEIVPPQEEVPPEEIELEIVCQDECSPAGIKECYGNGYRVCGNYDTDSCLEWSLVAICSSNTTCQNGNCIQRTCSDGTPNMQCSVTKPLYCQNFKLVDACMTCGCSGSMTCQGNSCVKEEATTPPAIEPIIFALNKEYANKFPDWKNEADEIIENINFVFAKSTSKQFKINKYLTYNDSEYTNLFTNPENYPEYYQDVSNRGGLTYILLIHKTGISNQELKQFYGSDNVNLAWTVYKGGKKYPTLLQANPESGNILLDEFRSILIFMPVHEIGHYLGLGVPDWYLYEYSDCTGINPKFPDYSTRKDSNFSKDPMTGLQIDVDIMKFNELNSAIINRNLNFKYTYDDVRTNWFSKVTKVYVTDRNGIPIPDTTVKIFCARKGCWYCSTQCSGATYSIGVPSTSVPEQTLLTDKNGYVTYNGPVGAWEMSESQNSPCIAKAIKVYHNGKSNVKIVNFIDLQKNYVLNNSNEYITHIILE